GIYLNLTAVLLPLESTTNAVDKAAKLVEEGKYYEANLALKAAEDGILVDSQSFIEWLEAMPAPTKKS
ncbi:MAG TPA: YfdX family protein, partial [Candidatus Bathyarchaeia archaeon]|nr:YfdX family protein [Candidatus Bathyarchaeia archaeon]